MANSSIIGQLRVVLGLDTAAFLKGATAAQKEMSRLGRDLGKIGDRISGVGQKMTLGITAPLAALGVGVVKMAGDFEAAMNQLQISTQASAREIKAMNELALDLGKTTVFSATEAAGAMDALAKAGLTAQEILGGAAKAAVDLAAATGSELEPAAAAITDVLKNFKLSLADLPKVVDQVTGAVNQSKFDFNDFQLAMGSAAGVAGAAGVSLEEFAAVLAGTSSRFNSGEDAGTSFKTFLTTLVPKSKAAANAMHDLGLTFFDANGNLKPMVEIAQMLKEKLGGLSEEARNNALSKIFGTDAMRTAIGLMEQGGDGMQRLLDLLGKTDAAQQAAQRMKGFNAQMEQLKGSLETLAIRIGQSGILEMVTGFVQALGNFVDQLSQASPAALQFGVAIAAIVGVIGPVLVAIGAVVSAIGTIAGVIAPLLPAIGTAGLGGSLAAAAAAAAPFVAAGLAIYAIWDELAPVFADLWARLSETFGPALSKLIDAASKAFTALFSGPLGEFLRVVIDLLGVMAGVFLRVFGHIVISALNGFLALATTVFTYIADALDVGAKLLSGDFAGAWEATGKLLVNLLKGLWSVVEAVFPGITGLVVKLYQAVKTWLMDKLGAVFDWLGKRVKEVGDFFYNLWDRVVGHSYVPDMVDEIGRQMARLDKVMVEPTRKATQKTADEFRKMAGEVSSLLRDLFPKQAAIQDAQDDYATLEAYKNSPDFDPAVYDRAKRALDHRTKQRLSTMRPDFGTPEADAYAMSGDMGGFTETATRRMEAAGLAASEAFSDGVTAALAKGKETRERLRDAFRDTVKDGFRALLDGNFGSWFEGWWKDRLSRAMEGALNSLADLIQRLFSNIGGGTGGTGGSIFSAIGNLFGGGKGAASSVLGSFVDQNPNRSYAEALQSILGGAKLPGLAKGGSIRIGGMGGIDRNLLSINGIPTAMVSANENIRITPNNDRGAEELVIRVEAVEGEMFAPRVASISRGQVNAGLQGAAQAQAQARRQDLR